MDKATHAYIVPLTLILLHGWTPHIFKDLFIFTCQRRPNQILCWGLLSFENDDRISNLVGYLYFWQCDVKEINLEKCSQQNK